MSAALGVVQVGVDHRGTPLALLERLHGALRRPALPDLRSQCAGVVRLTTCHRLELYMEGVSATQARRLLALWLGADVEEAELLAPCVQVRVDETAALHLMRVTAGLESAVLGEDQIQGQVRAAYRSACEAGQAGPLLHRLFHAAFRAGRRARSETPLKQGGRSLAGSGVALVTRELGSLDDKTVLVLGAGTMASLAAARLRERGVGRLVISNRTFSRAAELAAAQGGEALPWAWRGRIMHEIDAIVCACGASEPVIPAAWLADALAERVTPLVIVDLAVPRNVERPSHPLAGLTIVDVEALSRRLAEDAERREGAVLSAEAIVDEELKGWVSWVRARAQGVARGAAALRGSLAG